MCAKSLLWHNSTTLEGGGGGACAFLLLATNDICDGHRHFYEWSIHDNLLLFLSTGPGRLSRLWSFIALKWMWWSNWDDQTWD